MNTIPVVNVVFAFVPVILVLVIMFRWSLNVSDGFVALARMLIQLTLIGYALTWIFSMDSPALVLGILSGMLLIASSIALKPLGEGKTKGDYARALIAITFGLSLIHI